MTKLERAQRKRARRAAKPDASRYARANGFGAMVRPSPWTRNKQVREALIEAAKALPLPPRPSKGSKRKQPRPVDGRKRTGSRQRTASRSGRGR